MCKSNSKGFTLIECVLVIFILITIMSISYPVISGYNKMNSKKLLDITCENIIYFINTGKMYVKNSKVDGKLIVLNNKSVFISGNGFGKEYKLPEGFTITSLSSNLSRKISYEGFINEGCTWEIADKYGNKKQIVILVSTGYAEIK